MHQAYSCLYALWSAVLHLVGLFIQRCTRSVCASKCFPQGNRSIPNHLGSADSFICLFRKTLAGQCNSARDNGLILLTGRTRNVIMPPAGSRGFLMGIVWHANTHESFNVAGVCPRQLFGGLGPNLFTTNHLVVPVPLSTTQGRTQ